MDYISKETARRIIDSGRTKEQMLDMLENTPSVQPKVIEDIKAEIRSLSDLDTDYDRVWICDVIQIIDKHISGKE